MKRADTAKTGDRIIHVLNCSHVLGMLSELSRSITASEFVVTVAVTGNS